MGAFKVIVLVWSSLLLGVPALLFAIGYVPENMENRSRSPMPAFSPGSLVDTGYYADLARHLSDYLPMRSLAIRADSAIDLWLFSDSPTSSVVKGRDGWFFARESVVSDCLGEDERSRFQADRVTSLAQFLAAGNTRLLVAVVPDKESVYPEYLSGIARMGARCGDATREYLRRVLADTGDVYLDVFSLLERHRASPDHIPLYSPLDTHWTTYGSGLFAEQFVKATEPWSLVDARLERPGNDTGGGELSRMMAVDLPDTRGGRYIWSRPGVREGDNHVIPHGGRGEAYRLFGGVAEGSARLSDMKVVVIHDSFIYYTWDHLARFFETALYVHWGVVDNPEVAGFMSDADIVLIESAERFAFDRFVTFFSPATLAKLKEAEGSAEWEQMRAKVNRRQ